MGERVSMKNRKFSLKSLLRELNFPALSFGMIPVNQEENLLHFPQQKSGREERYMTIARNISQA